MSKHNNGFTLIEVLLALTLTSMLTAGLSIMIGQAAKDRHALEQQDEEPAWTAAVLDVMERDLSQAQWWAGGQDRVVLIGVGRSMLPAQIEYRWVETESGAALTRAEVVLAGQASRDSDQPCVLAIGLRGLQVGPYWFGQAPQEAESTDAQVVAPNIPDTPSLLIDGRAVSLQPVPEALTIGMTFVDQEADQRVQRGVLLQ